MTSFVWASYSGLWQIHQSAKAIGDLSTKPEWKKIEDYLVGSVPDRGGIDLREITSKSWSEHQAAYSDFILTQGAILYEEWCAALADMSVTAGKKVKSETFQFPSGSTSSKWMNWAVLDVPGTVAESVFLKNEVQPALLALYHSNITHLDALLKWYRFFKEARNSVTHHGGVMRQENVDAYNSAMLTPLKSAGMKRDFGGACPVPGSKVQFSLADAVLLLGIIQRLAYAFDAKHCHGSLAEADLCSRIKDALLKSPPPREATVTRKASWIKKFLSHRGGITPNSLATAESWLSTNNLVSIRTI